MAESKTNSAATAERLRKQIAKAEAALDILKNKLAKAEARVSGAPAPVTGLDLLWKEAFPIAKTRSSKFACRTEWNRIPLSERPTIAEALSALKIWKRCDEWKADGNTFVPGLHKWIKNRQWENLPEVTVVDPSARYRSAPKKPEPPSDPSEEVTDPAEIAKILGIKPISKSS